jgi:hypothetical protein
MLLEIFEVFVCLFAVYGMYALLCRILALLMRKDALSIAFHVDLEEEEPLSSVDGARQAEILTESMNGRLRPPVMLLEARPSEEQLLALYDLGLAVYIRKK